jgi:hypothetical protein
MAGRKQRSGGIAVVGESPKWYADLAALRPYQASDSIAVRVYRDSLSSSDPDNIVAATKPLIQLQLGRLEFQAGQRDLGVRTLWEAERAFQAKAFVLVCLAESGESRVHKDRRRCCRRYVFIPIFARPVKVATFFPLLSFQCS